MLEKNFSERRSSRDRRDWQEFVLKNRRNDRERRSDKDRRSKIDINFKPEKRRKIDTIEKELESVSEKQKKYKPEYYSTHEAAQLSGVSQPTLLLWLKNGTINNSKIKRNATGKRLWTRTDVEAIKRVRSREFGY